MLFSLFKLLGLKNSRLFASKIFVFFGPLFRSSIITTSNIERAFPYEDNNFKKKILSLTKYNNIESPNIVILTGGTNRIKDGLKIMWNFVQNQRK